jgi:hypothetical protein
MKQITSDKAPETIKQDIEGKRAERHVREFFGKLASLTLVHSLALSFYPIKSLLDYLFGHRWGRPYAFFSIDFVGASPMT